MILKSDFFSRDVVKVAKDLVGKYLVVKKDNRISAYKIIETEAYGGEDDLASHARFGKTDRSQIMYGSPGAWYVYMIYGMYHMLNIVCQPEDKPAAVLIRGLDGISGPGKLTRELGITKIFNGKLAAKATGLWIEDRGESLSPGQISSTPRIGIDYAGPVWRQKPYRFFLSQ